MRIHRTISFMIPAGFVVLATLAMGALGAVQEAPEKKIKRSDLPPAVQKTVDAQSAGAIIKGFRAEKENGQTFYEAEMVVNGLAKDILMDPTGAVVEVEQQVTLSSLPAEVQSGLRAKAGKGKIEKVESLTKHGKLVAFEAVVRTDGKKSEIQVGPDGKPLSHEE